MFVGGRELDKLRQYDLATPWDVRSYDKSSFSCQVLMNNIRNIQFNSDGTQLFYM